MGSSETHSYKSHLQMINIFLASQQNEISLLYKLLFA